MAAAAPGSAQPDRSEPGSAGGTASAAEAPKPPEPPLSDRDRLMRGKALYEAGDYAGCVRVFRGLLGQKAERALAERDATEKARLYFAACLVGVDQPQQADIVFRQAIRDSPHLQPNPLEFPRPVVDRFGAVRKTMLDEIAKADRERAERAKRVAEQRRAEVERKRVRERRLYELASHETIIVENSRWIAAVPFGVGQFQNRSPALGWVFLTTEALALTGTAVGIAWELELHGSVFDSDIDGKDWDRQVKTARALSTISLYSFAGLAVTGIVEAQLAFEPRFMRTRERALPPELRQQPNSPTARRPLPVPRVALLPAAAADGRGLGLVVAGRF